MLRPNIKNSRRGVNKSKGITFFLGLLAILGLSVVLLLSSDGNYGLEEKVVFDQEPGGEVLFSQETSDIHETDAFTAIPTLYPTATPVITPIPTENSPTTNPTNSPQPTQPSASADQASPRLGGYTGPALAPASDKRELLIISDTLPGNWTIEKNYGTGFVSGRNGQGLKIDEGGSLVLSGGEVFVASGTLSFWLKPSWNPSWYGEMPILEWNYEGNGNVSSLFEFSWARNVFLFTLYDEEQNQVGIGEAKKFEGLEGKWYHVDLTWDLTKEPFEMAIYIDGAKIDSGVVPFAPKNKKHSYFIIGGTLLNRNPASFIIDEMVLINWAKTEEEILSRLAS